MGNEMLELTNEQLDAISGGAWNRDTLTYDECRRLDLLTSEMVYSAANGPESARKQAYAKFTAYVATLEEKYGPSEWDWMSVIFG